MGRYNHRPSRSRLRKARRRGESEVKKGDHFAAFEQPALFAQELREHSIMHDATPFANNIERVISRIIDARMVSGRTSQRAFFGVSALLFAASAAVTIVWCASMSAMGEMPMPGGWTMSVAGMRMPGQTWPGAAGSFLGL